MVGSRRILIILSLALLGSTTLGFPSTDDNYDYYKDQEYRDDDYDDNYEDSPVNDVDGDSDNAIAIHRPVIISESTNIEVDNEMTIRLPCLVDKLPSDIQIIWSREDTKKKTQIAIGDMIIAQEYKDRATVNVNEKGSTLQIGLARSEDAGQYKCSVALRKNPPEVKHTVKIRAPPSIESSTPSILKVQLGDEVSLNCKGTGSPKPTVSWSRFGKKMPDGQDEIKTETIVFSDVTRKHSGTYVCSASNGHGKQATKQIQVIVEHPPEIEVTEVFVQTRTGDKAEIVCQVHASPPPKVEWELEGKRVPTNERVKISNYGSRHTLSISQVQREDFGRYVCKASNSLDSTHKVVELSGHASPADFKSAATGHSETSFLLEWTSKSFTPIDEFLLEVSEGSSSNWEKYQVVPTKDGAFHYHGKQFLTDLQPATQYKARISSKNGEGWGAPSRIAWNFATKGAVPSPASVTASASSVFSSSVMFLVLYLGYLFNRRHL